MDHALSIGKKSFYNAELDLSAYIVLDSVNRLPAIGGCRCLYYPKPELALLDAIKLSKAMSKKSAAHHLEHGGAKMVVALPKQFDRNLVMQQIGLWVNTMQGAYITANDSGTSIEDMETIAKYTKFVACKSKWPDYNPAYYTALGVYSSIKSVVGTIDDLSITIQGVGSVGMYLLDMLSKHKARLAISDIDQQKAAIANNIFSAEIISSDVCVYNECDVLVPCALGGILNAYSLPKIKARYIIGAANNQFNDPVQDAELAKNLGIIAVPDYIANGGGLVHVAGLYSNLTPEQIEHAVIKIGQRAKQYIGQK